MILFVAITCATQAQRHIAEPTLPCCCGPGVIALVYQYSGVVAAEDTIWTSTFNLVWVVLVLVEKSKGCKFPSFFFGDIYFL